MSVFTPASRPDFETNPTSYPAEKKSSHWPTYFCGGALLLTAVGLISLAAVKNFGVKKGKTATYAKLALGQAYQGERAFRAEFNSYTTDMGVVGESLSGAPLKYYKIGFAKPFGTEVNPHIEGYNPTRLNSDRLIASLGKHLPENSRFDMRHLDFQKIAENYCPDCVATADGFKILAAGMVDRSGKVDLWTIDNFHHLAHRGKRPAIFK